MTDTTRIGSDASACFVENLQDFYIGPVASLIEDFEADEEGLPHNIDAFLEISLVAGGSLAEACCSRSSSIPPRTRRSRRCAVSSRLASPVEREPVVQPKIYDDIVSYFDPGALATRHALVLYRTSASGFAYSHGAVVGIAGHPNIVAIETGTFSWPDSITLRRRAGDRIVISKPNVRYWAYAALFVGRVLYGELCLILYGKWRTELHPYGDLALEGDLASALPVTAKLDATRHVYDQMLIGGAAATGSCVAAVPYLKAWFELLGLHAGPVRPPVTVRLSSTERELLGQRLTAAGVS